MDRWGGVASRAVELHNQTGFASKEIAVGMATLFNLMSPGGVLKAPDSLWLNELIASLLTASALRGVRVLIIAPSRSGAPAPGWALPLMHDLLSRLLAAREVLAPGIAKAGGLFQIGLYGPDIGVDDLPRRVQALRTALARNSMLRGLYAFDPAVYHVLDSAEAIVGTPRANRDDPPATADVAVRPKLHFKGFLYVSREGWTQLIGGRPMAQGLQEYLAQRALQLREPQVGESVLADAMQQVGAIEINRVLENIPQHERRRLAFFLQVGSPNLNYRSMVMDGEAAVLVSGWTSLYAFPDFLLLTGISTWIEDQAELDRRLPPASGLKHRLARWVRMGL